MTGPPADHPVTRALDALDVGKAPRVGVACSGGVDSVVLLVAAARRFTAVGVPIVAIHADHGLRGAASDDDRRFVERLAAELGVPCRVAFLRLGESLPAGSLEQRAREARYAAFREFAAEAGLSHLLLAHHADDQAESVLLRILRGSGPRGLAAMGRTRPLTADCAIARPLLDLSRQALLDYAAHARLPWREDASNQDLRFARNRVRHRLLPALEARLPDARPRLLAVADAAAAVVRALEPLARTLAGRALRFAHDELLVLDRRLVAASDADAVFALLEALLAERTPDLAFGRQDLDGVLGAARGGGRRACALSGAWLARAAGPLLVLSLPEASPAPPVPLVLGAAVAVPGLVGRVAAAAVEGRPAVEKALDSGRSDPRVAVLAQDALRGRLEVGAVRAGERFQPLGAPGRRLVSDLLSRRRVPVALRGRLPVVRDESAVLWVAGCPPAARAKVVAATARALVLRWLDAPPASVLQPPAR